jgi:hypothetical protein
MVADADNGKTVPVSNPATGQVFGTVPNMVAAETRRAIEAANVAWPAASPQKVPIGHFEQPTKVEFVADLETAKALGLRLLRHADELMQRVPSLHIDT